MIYYALKIRNIVKIIELIPKKYITANYFLLKIWWNLLLKIKSTL